MMVIMFDDDVKGEEENVLKRDDILNKFKQNI